MPRIFLSYSHEDLDLVRKLEEALLAAGIEVWRDQQSLYGGEQWPKTIGEAIAASNELLLVWSARAAQSHFVEFEWTTALALKKRIVPCLVDDTPLPPALSAVNGISCEDIRAALPAIVKSINRPVEPIDSTRSSNVIDKLGEIDSTKPHEVLRQAKTVFNQKGWIVGGDVYAPGGDIVIHQRSKSDVIVVLSAFGSILLLVIIVFIFVIPSTPKQTNADGTSNKNENREEKPQSSFTGFVLNESGGPVEGASLEIEELPGQTVEITGLSTSDGDFHIDHIPAKVGDRGVVKVTASGYETRTESIVLPGPKTITLKKTR